MKKLFQVGDKIIGLIETLVSTCSLVVLVILVFLQVAMRYLLDSSFPWTEEVVTTLIVYMTFFGAARGVRRKEHTEVNGLANELPTSGGIAVRLLTTVITIGVLALMAYGSYVLGTRATNRTMMLRYPLAVNYFGVAYGCVFMLYEYGKLFKSRVLGR